MKFDREILGRLKFSFADWNARFASLKCATRFSAVAHIHLMHLCISRRNDCKAIVVISRNALRFISSAKRISSEAAASALSYLISCSNRSNIGEVKNCAIVISSPSQIFLTVATVGLFPCLCIILFNVDCVRPQIVDSLLTVIWRSSHNSSIRSLTASPIFIMNLLSAARSGTNSNRWTLPWQNSCVKRFLHDKWKVTFTLFPSLYNITPFELKKLTQKGWQTRFLVI